MATDSSRTRLAFSAEGTYAEVPVTPTMQALKFLSENLTGRNQVEISQIIRGDRMRDDSTIVGIDAQGGFDIEFSARTFDQLIEAALCGTWSTAGNVTFTDGVTNGTTTFTSATAAFVAGDVGKWITGTGIAANTYIVSVTNGTTVILSQAATTTASGQSFVIVARTAGNVLKNGTTNRSFLIEKAYLDSSQFFSYRGMVVNTWDFALNAQKKITGNFGFMGQRPIRAGTTVSGAITAVVDSPMMTAGPLVSGIESNTNMTGIKVRGLTFRVNNNLRLRPHVESITTDDPGRGPFDITGTIDAYFADGALYDQFIANGVINFQFSFGDGTHLYTVRIPRFKLPEATVETPGIDADVPLRVNFQGFADPTLACALQITRT